MSTLLGRSRSVDETTPPPDGGKALEQAEQDWIKVHEVRARAERLKAENGFGHALRRSMGQKP